MGRVLESVQGAQDLELGPDLELRFQNSFKIPHSDIMVLAVSRQAEYFVLHVEFCYLCYLLIELVDSMHQSNMIWHRMWLWSHRLKNLWVKGYIMSVSSDFKIEKTTAAAAAALTFVSLFWRTTRNRSRLHLT